MSRDPQDEILAELIEAAGAAREGALRSLPVGSRRTAVAWAFDQEIAYLRAVRSGEEASFAAESPPPLADVSPPQQALLRGFMSRVLAKSMFGKPGREAPPSQSPMPDTAVVPARRARRDLTGV